MKLPILLVEAGETIRFLSNDYTVHGLVHTNDTVTVTVTNGTRVRKTLTFHEDDTVTMVAD